MTNADDPMRSPDSTLQRFAFLAAAGEVLTASLDDHQRTLQQLTRLAVPVLGDLCVVDIVENGELRRVATHHACRDKIALLDQLAGRNPVTAGSAVPAARVLASGQPLLLQHVDENRIAEHTVDGQHAALISEIGIRSLVAVPMRARGATIGVISIGISESDRRYDDDDVALAGDLARQAGLAIDNARLYRQAQQELAERRRAEAALRFSEQRLRAIVEQFPMPMQIFSPDGRTRAVNRAWEALWRVPPGALEDYNVLEDPQLQEHGIASQLRRAFSGEPVRLPTVPYDVDRTLPGQGLDQDPVRWVSAFAYPVKDDGGTVREVVLVHEDVTEARNSERRLRASEERLRLALDAGRMNAWDWNLATDVIECSENAREFWGIHVGLASDFVARVHPDDRAIIEQAGRHAIDGKAAYRCEYRIPGRDGVRWVESRGRVERDATGTAQRILGVTIDITELKRAEQTTALLADAGDALHASLDYPHTLGNLARVVVPRLADWYAVDLLTDDDRLQRVAVHHSDPERTAIATELLRRFPADRSKAYGAWQVIESGQPQWVETIDDAMLESFAQDADHLAVLRGLGLRSFIRVPLVSRGSSIGVLTLVFAESGRRYLQADVELALDLARRAAAAVDNARLYGQLEQEHQRKDAFLATLAHELRNPLAPIRTGLALLGADPEPSRARRVREIMERQLGHLVRLVDDLLDLSRVTRDRIELRIEPVDARAVVASAVETSRPLIDEAGVALRLELPEQPLMIDADPTRIAQVVSNLLNNSARFTDAGGRIELALRRDRDNVVVEVSDTGIGIDPAMLERIFDMFAQVDAPAARSRSGLGIGLTLVRRLVELHHGEVRAHSRGRGHGSRFTVSLPRSRQAAAPELQQTGPAAAGQLRETSPRCRVLVVDDNADAAETLATLLTIEGHEVRTAASGPDALALIDGFVPDIAFLDVGMPLMDGYELARRIRALPRFGSTTLVALTGWGQEEDRRRSREAGLDHHLTKPVDFSEVLELVERSSSVEAHKGGG